MSDYILSYSWMYEYIMEIYQLGRVRTPGGRHDGGRQSDKKLL